MTSYLSDADAEEQDSAGLTAFHVAVQHGHASVATYFLKTYTPKEDDYAPIYKSPRTGDVLFLAVKSFEPEVVWMVLDNGLFIEQHINEIWPWITSTAARNAFVRDLGHPLNAVDNEKIDDITKLLKQYSHLSPPATPVESEQKEQSPSNVRKPLFERGGRGVGGKSGRGRGRCV